MADERLTSVARKLRRDRTEAEDRLWAVLRNRQIDDAKFLFQFPIGSHVTDFARRPARLVVEIDGGQHALSTADAERTRSIEDHGYTVIRFWNNDVFENLEGVVEEIRRMLKIARNEG